MPENNKNINDPLGTGVIQQRNDQKKSEQTVQSSTQAIQQAGKDFKESSTDLMGWMSKLENEIKEIVHSNQELTGRIDEDIKVTAENEKKRQKEQSEFSKSLNKTFSSTMSSLSSTVDRYADTISKAADSFNTRLDGTVYSYENLMDATVVSYGNILYKTEDYLDNLSTLINSGVAYNIEQRALLETLSDRIITTFDSQNQTLRQLIRLQSDDSTAARMGLEVAINQMLNTEFQNTEYLSNVFDTVTANLYEAEAQMGSQMAAEFEYTVQRWLGSLYSAGLSDSTVSSLSTALGQLGSGNIEGLIGTNIGNLITAGIQRSGLSYYDIAHSGLDSDSTNKLLASIVTYMQEMSQNTSLISRNQLASAFGLNASDLIAASNPNLYTGDVYGSALASYDDLTDILMNRLGTYTNRLSIPTLLKNIGGNMQFAFANDVLDADSAGWYLASNAFGLVGDGVGSLLESIPFIGSSLSSFVNGMESLATIAAWAEGGISSGTIGTDVVGLFEALSNKQSLLANSSGAGYTTNQTLSSNIRTLYTNDENEYTAQSALNVVASAGNISNGIIVGIGNGVSQIVGILDNILSEIGKLTGISISSPSVVYENGGSF